MTILDGDGNPVEIATDDGGAGGQVQLVKLAIATDGSATPVPADANGITVKNSTPINLQTRVEGREGHDGLSTSNPVRIAGQYSANPPRVSASGDTTNIVVSQDGKLLDVHSAPAAATTNVNTNYSSAQTNTSLVSAPGASKRLVVVEIIYSRDTAGNMKLVQDTAGSPTAKFGPHYFANNGGLVSTKVYIPLTENKNLGITSVGGGNETITLRVITEEV